MVQLLRPKRKPKPKTLAAVRPNVGLTVKYQRRVDVALEAMQRDIVRKLTKQWREKPPVQTTVAEDASPSRDLAKLMSRLGIKWRGRFRDLANELAAYFAKSAATRVDAQLRASLKKAGFAVEFRMTAAQQDAIAATTAANVSLIKSIASEHLTDVEGAVMRSVQAGRDVGGLVTELEATYGVTKRRASTIARDQNAKATATITRVRQEELGIKQAKWLHSAGGKVPRPSHVANSGKLYDVAKGWFDPDANMWIRPGELINCRCVSVSVIPGFD